MSRKRKSRRDEIFIVRRFQKLSNVLKIENGEDIPRALDEMFRVLKPAGRLLVSFHGGEGELHREEWYGQPVSIDVTLMTRDEMSVTCKQRGSATRK